MATRQLSPREEQIVDLCIHGLTNDGIAEHLGLSIGTVNTYWIRIKLKIGGSGKTDTVVRAIQEKADRLLFDAIAQQKILECIIAENERRLLEYRAELVRLHLDMDRTKSAIWTMDEDLEIHVIENGIPASCHSVHLDIGKTVFEIFETKDPESAPVAAHLAALTGLESKVRLEGDPQDMFLRVVPLSDSAKHVSGCVGILSAVAYLA